MINQIVDEAIQNERDRLKAIDEIANGIPDDVLKKAKYDEPLSAADLALAQMKDLRKSFWSFKIRVHTISTWSRLPILFRQSGRALSFQRKMDLHCLLYIIRGVMSLWIQ